MYILTGFGDEISPELTEQLDVMAGEGISALEIRSVWGKNILDLTPDECARVKTTLTEKGFRISSIGSPIGKIKITDDFAPHFERFQHAVELARFFDAPFLRIFSYYPPDGGDIRKYRDEVLKRMSAKARYAQQQGVMLANENELNLYGESPEGCKDILDAVNSPNLKTCFDPGNFIIAGINPADHAYPMLKDSIVYFHIKDGLPKSKTGGAIVCLPTGEGEGGIKTILADFATTAARKDVFLSLEPHLAKAGKFQGFSGPGLFKTASDALKRTLKDISDVNGET